MQIPRPRTRRAGPASGAAVAVVAPGGTCSIAQIADTPGEQMHYRSHVAETTEASTTDLPAGVLRDGFTVVERGAAPSRSRRALRSGAGAGTA